MTRTRVAAPQFTNAKDAAETAQQPAVDLNPGTKGQEEVELAPPISPRDLETTAFYEQPVRIMLHDKTEDIGPGVEISVNGEGCRIPFGMPVVVKRKFVQQLLDMRETKFTQPRRDSMNVESGNKLVPRTVLIYPFTVQEDPHPHGGAWLQNELRKQQSIATGLR